GSALPPPPAHTRLTYTTLFRSATCGAAFRQMPEELARITAFVEAEMKGQNLPNAPSNRDEFIATTFARMYPLVLSSDECRQAVEDRKSTRLNPVTFRSRMPSSA